MFVLVACHDPILHANLGSFDCRLPKPYTLDFIDVAGGIESEEQYKDYLDAMMADVEGVPATLAALRAAHAEYNATHATSKIFTSWDALTPRTYDYIFFAACPALGPVDSVVVELFLQARRVLKRGGKVIVKKPLWQFEEKLSERRMMKYGHQSPPENLALIQHRVAAGRRHGLDYWFSSGGHDWMELPSYNRLYGEYIKIKE